MSRRDDTMPSADTIATTACTCGRLRRAARALTQLYDDLMAPSGLRVTQFSLLRTLSREGTSRMSALAELLLLDRTALSRTLDPLVERGFVAIVAGRWQQRNRWNRRRDWKRWRARFRRHDRRRRRWNRRRQWFRWLELERKRPGW